MFKISNKVRRLSDKEKLQYKIDGYITGLPVFSKEAKNNLEFCKLDLTSDEGWEDAMDGCTYVLHVASPVSIQGTKK